MVSYWFQIGTNNFRLCPKISDFFRFVLDWSGKIVRTSDFVFTFRLLQIGRSLDRKGEDCHSSSHLWGWGSVTEQYVTADGGYVCRPGNTYGGCGGSGKFFQEGNEGESQRSQGQNRRCQSRRLFSSARTTSTATAASTAASLFTRDPTSNCSFVGVSRRCDYTLIIIIL